MELWEMKALLVSDTHGKLDVINKLAAATGAECCLHMGDLGLYTAESVSRFSADMLYKQLQHAPALPRETLAAINRNDVDAMRLQALKYRTYGDFEDYLSGKKRFNIPMYAILGNNDAAEIAIQAATHQLENLEFLNDENILAMEGFLICGIGGDIGESSPFVGGGYLSPEARIAKFEIRLEAFKKKMEFTADKIILLTHIPPYENERLMQLAKKINPALCLCGHTHHWDDRTVGMCRTITIPRPDRGYAVLELDNGQWNCRLYKNDEARA